MGRNIFIKNVWDYDPEDWPVIVFGLEKARQNFLKDAKPNDLVLLRTSSSSMVPDGKEKKLLALAEFDYGRLLYSEDVLKHEVLNNLDYIKDGSFRWNYALEIKRVKILTPMQDDTKLENIEEYDKKSNFGSAAVRLTDADASKVLRLSMKEARLGKLRRQEEQHADKNFSMADKPTKGPPPEFDTGSATTYALRFGNKNAWKIGYTQRMLEARMIDINVNVPYENLGEKWLEYKKESWHSADDAYDMEQEVLNLLSEKRTHGELVECTEGELNNAWKEAVIKINKG